MLCVRVLSLFLLASDKIADILIKNGVKDISVQDHMGKTPLYYAKQTGDLFSIVSIEKSNKRIVRFKFQKINEYFDFSMSSNPIFRQFEVPRNFKTFSIYARNCCNATHECRVGASCIWILFTDHSLINFFF